MLLTAASSRMLCSESTRRMRQADTAPATDKLMSAPMAAASAIASVPGDTAKASIASTKTKVRTKPSAPAKATMRQSRFSRSLLSSASMP